jgi:PTH1 family peptidyl-tRNA hydrolase
MKVSVLVGLGNPGSQYLSTRHNLGFVIADAFVKAYAGEWRFESAFNAQLSQVAVSGQKIFILKPLTFMNLSGDAVGRFCRYYGVIPQSICVIYDDRALPLGHLKLSAGKGSGGHNGVASVIQHLGKDFFRLRAGIGECSVAAMSLSDYVLSKFSKEEQLEIEKKMPYFVEALTLLVDKGSIKAMNSINSFSP